MAGAREQTGGERRLAMSLERRELAPARARNALKEWVGDDAAAAAELPTLTLLVSEVVTNAVVHSDAAVDSPIELSLVTGPSLTRVVVTDEGRGFVPSVGSRRPASGGGFGLLLLDEAASRWGTSDGDGRFSVWFELDHAP